MCHDDIDHVLRQLAECRDTAAMRRLLQTADPCHGCPDGKSTALDINACLCRIRSCQDLGDRVYHALSVRPREPMQSPGDGGAAVPPGLPSGTDPVNP
jgi:hypothetical protein